MKPTINYIGQLMEVMIFHNIKSDSQSRDVLVLAHNTHIEGEVLTRYK